MIVVDIDVTVKHVLAASQLTWRGFACCGSILTGGDVTRHYAGGDALMRAGSCAVAVCWSAVWTPHEPQ